MIRPVRSSRRRPEDGAVAIMTAILAALLLIAGALAVDLGNAWARQRDMQTQADVAALAAGNWARDQNPIMWPADTVAEQDAITQKAAEYIVEDNNNAIGMTQTTAGAVVAALQDGNMANGDIEFLDSGRQMRLTPPPATVNFGMAAVFGYGSVDVSAPATVEVKSEIPGQDVVPLWIPKGCFFGAVEADTDGGQPTVDDEDDTGDFTIDTMAPNTASVGQTLNVNFSAKKNNFTTPPVVTFERIDDGTTITAPSTNYAESGADATFRFAVGTNITAENSTWSVTVTGKNGTVSSPLTFTVGSGSPPATDPEAGCEGQDRGNFGQLNSPRTGFGGNDTGSRGNRLLANMLYGLDHQLVPHPNATQDSCETPPLANSQYDSAVQYGNNCIIGDTGNDGSKFADALINGSGGQPGRLDASNGDTYSGCSGRSNTNVGGRLLNYDDISCFLQDKPDGTSYTALDVTQATATRDMLDPAIVNSPRFVWIPVVYAGDRSIKDFQPILRFVPGLITSQNTTTSADDFDASTGFQNGVECNGGSGNCNSLSAIRIFTFNPRAVPNLSDSPVVDYDPTIGREVVKLVE